MSDITLIKKIREETGAGVIDIKKAFDEAAGDEQKTREILAKLASAKAKNKVDRAAGAGLIECYNHASRIGALVEVNCETDFVARNRQFKTFVHDIALQIASMNPTDVNDLLSQPFIKDEAQTVKQFLESLISKIGENIVIKRFERYELGE